jgi:hypothetical protein
MMTASLLARVCTNCECIWLGKFKLRSDPSAQLVKTFLANGHLTPSYLLLPEGAAFLGLMWSATNARSPILFWAPLEVCEHF